MPPSTYELRPASAADAPQLVTLMKSVALEGKWVRTQWPFDEAERTRRFAASLESGSARCIVTECAGRTIAQLTLFPDGRNADLGIQELHLEVYAHNAAAFALYERAGFERFGGTYEEARRSDEAFEVVRMRKSLP